MSVAVPLTKDDGAADAAALLYERHANRIFSFCVRRLRSREEAEDAVQQTFLKAFAAMRGGFRPNAERAWLYRIAENVCADRLRASSRRGRHEAGDVTELSEVLPARDAHPPIEGLDQALLELTPAQRQALLLREWQGMSYREIASELRLSQSAVETLLFRARRSLARRLEDQRAELRSRATDLAALAGGLKSALSGGLAAKAAIAVVAAGSVGAAAVAPLVGENRRPFDPAPAQSVRREAPTRDVDPARRTRAVMPAERSGPTRERENAAVRPAVTPQTPGSTTSPRSPRDSRAATAPTSVQSQPVPSDPPRGEAPAPPPPATEVPEPALPVTPPPLPVTPPPLPTPELPPAPDLPAPDLQVPPVDQTIDTVTESVPELPSLP